jgi:hypothetical protein
MLCICIDGDELNALKADINHAINRIDSSATDSNNLDDS